MSFDILGFVWHIKIYHYLFPISFTFLKSIGNNQICLFCPSVFQHYLPDEIFIHLNLFVHVILSLLLNIFFSTAGMYFNIVFFVGMFSSNLWTKYFRKSAIHWASFHYINSYYYILPLGVGGISVLKLYYIKQWFPPALC